MKMKDKKNMMNKTEKRGKKVMRIVAIVLLVIVMILIIGILCYLYSCTHYNNKEIRNLKKAGFVEKDVATEEGNTIHYAEGPDNGPGLLLIHGQTGSWIDYGTVAPELSKNWHVFCVDCYGHGKSEHKEELYYIDEIGDDLIWFTDNVIKEKTIVSGHSSGGLLASYVAAYGGENVMGSVLEDPPFFNTENEEWETSFAYVDTYKTMHDYLNSDQSEPYEAYYLEHCKWGELYMKPELMDKMVSYAKKYLAKHPEGPLVYSYLPGTVNRMFMDWPQYDLNFGVHFYDQSWMNGLSQEQILKDIDCPTVYLHAKDSYTDDGILLAATSNKDARKAESLIKCCKLTELVSGHDIHREHPDVFVDAVNSLEK